MNGWRLQAAEIKWQGDLKTDGVGFASCHVGTATIKNTGCPFAPRLCNSSSDQRIALVRAIRLEAHRQVSGSRVS